MSDDGEHRCLRIATYLVPDYPLSLYQTLQYYLESVLGCSCLLVIESRVKGAIDSENNPFTNNLVDLGENDFCDCHWCIVFFVVSRSAIVIVLVECVGFIFNSTYIASKDDRNMELLPVAPVREKPKGPSKPEYSGNLILSKSRQ